MLPGGGILDHRQTSVPNASVPASLTVSRPRNLMVKQRGGNDEHSFVVPPYRPAACDPAFDHAPEDPMGFRAPARNDRRLGVIRLKASKP